MSSTSEREPSSWLRARVRAVRNFLAQGVWSMELGGLPTLRAFAYKTMRVSYLAARGFVEDRCLFRSSALTYITVLSLVPMLAFAFSVAKGLGAYQSIRQDALDPFLDRMLGPTVAAASADGSAAGVELRGAIDKVLAFVQDTDVRKLGAFGLLILAFTVIKLLGSIEQSFNEIWGVHKARSLARKVSDYLSIIVIVPILLTAATAATTAIQGQRIAGFLEGQLGLSQFAEYYAHFTSLAAIWAGFTFVFLFMPNTRVRVGSALLGGIVGGSLWQIAMVLHVKFQIGVANYNAIYSTFAALPIFMFWLYVSWVTVLLGAEVAFAHQNEPAYRQVARSRHHDQSFKEVLALRAMVRVAMTFLAGQPPRHTVQLALDLHVPERSLDEVLERLRSAGLVALADEHAGLDVEVLPARALEHIRLGDVLDALRDKREVYQVPRHDRLDERLATALARYEDDVAGASGNLDLRRLAERCLEAGERAEDEDEAGARALLEGV
ncbi:MAG: YihY/virulence factor BrkB family protein [Planctomycetota bacterium]